jgi:hypothetical protein
MELEPSPGNFQPIIDRRPLVPEPLPVKLVAIEDVRLPATSGLENKLDLFYVTMLGFERDDSAEGSIVYCAENFRLHFETLEPPVQRDSMRSIGIEVMSLADVERKIVEREMEYTRQRSLTPGQETLFLQDPAGNWLTIGEFKLVQ